MKLTAEEVDRKIKSIKSDFASGFEWDQVGKTITWVSVLNLISATSACTPFWLNPWVRWFGFLNLVCFVVRTTIAHENKILELEKRIKELESRHDTAQR